MSDPTLDKPLRADARRNRERLLDAALALFLEDGPDVPLEAVAKRAGVGIGTLYRHFPTREALVEAAYRSEVAHLAEAADELLRDRPPDEALAAFMDRFVDYAATKRGLKGMLMSVAESGSDVFVDTRTQITAAVASLVEAGVAAGAIRADVDADDVLRAMGAVWAVPAGSEDQARRVLMLVMDGLRHGAVQAGRTSPPAG
jgi:AcrR family transcriptional regulator